jgi:hypothetical protein
MGGATIDAPKNQRNIASPHKHLGLSNRQSFKALPAASKTPVKAWDKKNQV